MDGKKIFLDASLVEADASNSSVLDMKSLKGQLHQRYQELEARLEEKSESANPSRSYEKKNGRYISATDPDASIVNRGQPKLRYQVHRAVDEAHEVITATKAAPGEVNEAHLLVPFSINRPPASPARPWSPTANTAPSRTSWPAPTGE